LLCKKVSAEAYLAGEEWGKKKKKGKERNRGNKRGVAEWSVGLTRMELKKKKRRRRKSSGEEKKKGNGHSQALAEVCRRPGGRGKRGKRSKKKGGRALAGDLPALAFSVFAQKEGKEKKRGREKNKEVLFFSPSSHRDE